jgi:predicted nucleic acid-binding protein
MKSLLVDANVLVYSLVENCPQNGAARDKLNGLLQKRTELILCPQIVHESYSILTRHYGVKPASAVDWLGRVLNRPDMEFLEPGLAETRLALELAARKGLSGHGFFDACLAALVLNFSLGGICTDNERDFRRLGVSVEPMRGA